MSEPIVAAKFEKNAKEEVWVAIEEYAGRKLIDIRVHYQADTGNWHPTKRDSRCRLTDTAILRRRS